MEHNDDNATTTQKAVSSDKATSPQELFLVGKAKGDGRNEKRFAANDDGAATDQSVQGDMEFSTPPAQGIDSATNINVCIDHKNAGHEDQNVPDSRGGLVNTPASYFTDISEYKTGRSQQIPSGSREAMYQRAMNLMSERCQSEQPGTSGQPSTLIDAEDPPINVHGPSVFFVEQTKPVPMPPLKVWRGYHGNVYFEPIKVAPVSTQGEMVLPQQRLVNHSKFYQEKSHAGSSCSSKRTRERTSLSPSWPGRPYEGAVRGTVSESLPWRHGSSLPSAIKRTSKSAPSTYMRQMAVLDKRSVFQKYNNYIHEDIDWIMAQESTGSLCVMTPKRGHGDPRLKWDKERICKGSVARQLYTNRNGKNPLFSINGSRTSSSTTKRKSHLGHLTSDDEGQLPALGHEKPVNPTIEFHHIIPTLEKMNLDDLPSEFTQ